MVFSAILKPPDADPVIPANTLTTTASEIRGLLGDKPTKKSRTTRNAPKEAITEPYPTSDAVLKIGSNEPNVPLLIVVLRSFQRVQLLIISTKHASTRAQIIAYVPSTELKAVAPYLASDRYVVSSNGNKYFESAKLAVITKIMGSNAMPILGSFEVSTSTNWS